MTLPTSRVYETNGLHTSKKSNTTSTLIRVRPEVVVRAPYLKMIMSDNRRNNPMFRILESGMPKPSSTFT
jgi:hypothetical protein